jgi:hypothetical protein
MEGAVASGRGRWGTAVGLTLAVLFLAVFDALAMVLLPLALLLIALPAERRGRWLVGGALLWALAFLLAGGALAVVSRGWALSVGGIYLVLSVARPQWDVTSRALATVGAAVAMGLLALVATGQAPVLDTLVRTHLEAVPINPLTGLQTRWPDAEWVTEMRATSERVVEWQIRFYPALLALQSLAALALVSWWVRRLGRSESATFSLAPLREFRFHDELIWVLIAAVLLVLLPLGEGATRVGVNALVFMAALYALRGLAVFVFLAAGSRSLLTMVLGAMALIFLYPVVFTAALLVGVGDTWLDVRRRAAMPRPT